MELLKVDVNLEIPLHDLEAIVKGHIERTPHLLGHVAEGPLARLDLLVQKLALLAAAAVVVKQDVAGVLHEDGAIEVWLVRLALRIRARPATAGRHTGKADDLSLLLRNVGDRAELLRAQVLDLDLWGCDGGRHFGGCFWIGEECCNM